jgi:putative transposase
MAAAVTGRLAVDALDLAVRRRGVTAGLVAHPGRGSRYAGGHSRSALRRHGMACGASGVGQCRSDAVAGSTFGRLKRELVPREAARASPFESVDVFLDRVRRPSALGYLSPAEYERTHDPNLR